MVDSMAEMLGRGREHRRAFGLLAAAAEPLTVDELETDSDRAIPLDPE